MTATLQHQVIESHRQRRWECQIIITRAVRAAVFTRAKPFKVHAMGFDSQKYPTILYKLQYLGSNIHMSKINIVSIFSNTLGNDHTSNDSSETIVDRTPKCPRSH